MKKQFASIMLVFFLSSTAFATPFIVAIPAVAFVASVALHSQIAGLYYYMTSSPATVSSVGNIEKGSTITWIDTSMTLQTKSVNASLPYGSLLMMASKKDLDGNPIYPALNSALYTNDVKDLMTAVAGSYMDATHDGYGKYQLGALLETSGAGCVSAGTKLPSMTGFSSDRPAIQINRPFSTGGYCEGMGMVGSKSFIFYADTATTPPPPKGKTVAEAVPLLTGISGNITTPQNLINAYENEVDKMLQDPSYIPTFTDASTGLPYIQPQPSSVSTPAQVEAYNKNVAVAAAGSAAATAAGNAVASGSGSSASYRAAADAAQAAAAANPGDAGLSQKAKDAEAAAAGAKLAEDKLKAEQAKNEADKAANNAITAPKSGDAYGSSDTNDYGFGTRFTKFMSDMKSSTLFTLPSTLLGNIPSSSQSDFNVSFGRFGSTNFDLANFGSAIALLRSLVLIIFSVVSFKIITLKGGGG